MPGHTSFTLDHSPAKTGSKGPHISGILGSVVPAAVQPFVAQLLALTGSAVPNQWTCLEPTSNLSSSAL